MRCGSSYGRGTLLIRFIDTECMRANAPGERSYTFIIHAKGAALYMVFVKFYFYIGVRPRIKETFLKTILYDIKMRFHDKSTDAFSQYVKISTL